MLPEEYQKKSTPSVNSGYQLLPCGILLNWPVECNEVTNITNLKVQKTCVVCDF